MIDMLSTAIGMIGDPLSLLLHWWMVLCNERVTVRHRQNTQVLEYSGSHSVMSPRVAWVPWSTSRVSVMAGSKMLRVSSSILSC
jgi:hypothetical protein